MGPVDASLNLKTSNDSPYDREKIMGLKHQFINSFIAEVAQLNGTQFEEIGCYVMELCTGQELIQKGHNPQGKPVGYTVDYEQLDNVTMVGQSGTDADYFSSGKKPRDDVKSSLKNCKNCKIVYLFSNRRATGGELKTINNELSELYPEIIVRVYDSEAIANKVYEKIICEFRIKQILKYLPMTHRYYQMYAHSHSIPTQSLGYVSRREEEEIKKLLEEEDFLQIYGLSGIGKTQLAIAIAEAWYKKFDVVIWINGESLNTNNLRAIQISSVDQRMSMEDILANQKCFIVVDNLNKNLNRVKEQFDKFNKKGSKCIITSLQRDFKGNFAYHLEFLQPNSAMQILMQADDELKLEQAEQIVHRIGGYPLMLNLTKAAVNCGDYTWDEIIKMNELTEIPDERENNSFAKRIIGKYYDSYPLFFDIILLLDSTRICRALLYEYNVVQYKQMVRAAVLDENELFYCHLHSIVLESIKSYRSSKENNDEYVIACLSEYLDRHLMKRDAELYTLTSAHSDKLEHLVSSKGVGETLKHKIALACLYAQNTYINHEKYLNLIDGLTLRPSDCLEDLLLAIERNEIFINKRFEDSGRNEEVRQQTVSKIISEFAGMASNISGDILKSVFFHHLAKWTKYSDEAGSEHLFIRALQYNPKLYNSRLQLARLYGRQGMMEKAYSQTDVIIKDAINGNVPLSVVLSVFSLLATSKHSRKLKQYLKNDIELLENSIEASVSCHNTQVYYVLSKLSGTLSYEYGDVYNRMCNSLPSIFDIKHNEDDSYNYACILLRLYQYVDTEDDIKELHFQRALSILTSIELKDDYMRRTLMTLYIAHGYADKALSISETFTEKNNVFLLQSMCKAYILKADYDNAMKSIEEAILNEENFSQAHKAAFRHDKAIILFKQKDKICLDVLKEAISLQTSDKVKQQWRSDFEEWEKTLEL